MECLDCQVNTPDGAQRMVGLGFDLEVKVGDRVLLACRENLSGGDADLSKSDIQRSLSKRPGYDAS
jgi:hypothetical protein